jgi:hypothetical protein
MVQTPPPGLRDYLAATARRADALTSAPRVLQAVERRLHAPRRRQRLLIVTVAAAVAASLTAAVLLPRVVHRVEPVAPAAPPTGVPLVWGQGGGGATADGKLIAYDWNGHRVGTLQVGDPSMPLATQPAPDGMTVLVVPTQGDAYLLDASGRRLGNLPALKTPHWKQLPHGFVYFRTIFSPDDRTLCVTGGDAYEHPVLHVMRPGGDDRAIIDLGPGSVYGPTWNVVACDAGNDRAVLEGLTKGNGISAVYRVIQLSTGRELSRRVYPYDNGPVPTGLHLSALSPDGRWLAEGRGSAGDSIIDLDTGAVVAHVPAGVRAILAGGTRVLYEDEYTKPSPYGGKPAQRYRIVDVASGRTLWEHDFGSLANVTVSAAEPLVSFTLYDNAECPDRQWTLVSFPGQDGTAHTATACNS